MQAALLLNRIDGTTGRHLGGDREAASGQSEEQLNLNGDFVGGQKDA